MTAILIEGLNKRDIVTIDLNVGDLPDFPVMIPNIIDDIMRNIFDKANKKIP